MRSGSIIGFARLESAIPLHCYSKARSTRRRRNYVRDFPWVVKVSATRLHVRLSSRWSRLQTRGASSNFAHDAMAACACFRYEDLYVLQRLDRLYRQTDGWTRMRLARALEMDGRLTLVRRLQS